MNQTVYRIFYLLVSKPLCCRRRYEQGKFLDCAFEEKAASQRSLHSVVFGTLAYSLQSYVIVDYGI